MIPIHLLVMSLAAWPIADRRPNQAAGGTHVLVVSGLAGEPQYRASFSKLAAAVADAARQRWGVTDSSLVHLAEDPAIDRTRITGRSTKAEVLAALTRLEARARPDDVVLVILLGHGSQQGDIPQFNLPGPDLSAPELAAALDKFAGRTVVVVNASSASGGFVPVLAARGRVIVTATKSGFERNATSFGEWFVKGLTTDQADADKNGRVSVAEAFTYARREVVRSYQAEKRLLTEHAQLDDDGDGKASAELGATGDGGLAKAIAFALATAPVVDPALAPLVAERGRLEAAIATLRGRKASMDAAAYERELERLLVRLAEVNESIRAGSVKP